MVPKSKTRGQVVGVRCQLVIHANFRRGPTNRLLKASPAEEKKPGNFIFAHRTNCLQACLSGHFNFRTNNSAFFWPCWPVIWKAILLKTLKGLTMAFLDHQAMLGSVVLTRYYPTNIPPKNPNQKHSLPALPLGSHFGPPEGRKRRRLSFGMVSSLLAEFPPEWQKSSFQ